MIPIMAIAGARTRVRGDARAQAGAAPARLCCSPRAWVIEVTPEDQVLWVQEFLQQPKKGFISLTILIRGQ